MYKKYGQNTSSSMYRPILYIICSIQTRYICCCRWPQITNFISSELTYAMVAIFINTYTVYTCAASWISYSITFSGPYTEAEFLYTQCGTREFISPETCNGLPYTSKADIWALGVTLYKMVTGNAYLPVSWLSSVKKHLNFITGSVISWGD